MFVSKRFMRATVLAVAFGISGLVPALAEELVGGYRAYIGNADLYNSKGQRLSTVEQVLRQDRANVHRFNISQAGDEWDPYFDSYEGRSEMDRLLRNGSISAGARQVLSQGGGAVYVGVYGDGGGITSLRVGVSP